MNIYQRLQLAGIVLPEVTPKGKYSVGVTSDSLLFVSGQGPIGDGIDPVIGIVGDSVSLATAKLAARRTGINLLAAASTCGESFGRVQGLLSLTVYVTASQGFTDHIAVADGCSEFFSEIFAPNMLGTRVAVGVASLPFGLAIEASAVFKLAP